MSRGNSLYLSNETVPYVNSFKYLCIKFLVKKSLTIDVPFIKRKLYYTCDSILMRIIKHIVGIMHFEKFLILIGGSPLDSFSISIVCYTSNITMIFSVGDLCQILV